MIPDSNELRFEVTTHCNYDCVMCPREKLTRPLEVMSTKLFEEILGRIVKENKQFDTVSFPGFGEPLMDKGFVEKVRIAASHNMRTMLLTNGYLLTPELFDELQNVGMESVRISFYGMTDESYDDVHKPAKKGAFNKVTNNLLKICKIKKNTQVLMTLNVVKGMNDQDVQTWIDTWQPITDLVEVWRPHNWVDGMDYRDNALQKEKTCGRPWNTPIQIQADGTVNMCCFDFDGKLLLGDLKNNSLEEIFEGDAFKKILHHHTTGNYEGSGLICDVCDQRNIDKSDVAIYNSKFALKDRVGKVSTTYQNL